MSVEDERMPVMRPGKVTAVAVMGFIWGGLAVLGLVWVVTRLVSPGADKVFQTLIEDPVYHAWVIVSIPVGVIQGVGWILAGVGLLRMRVWARTLTLLLLVFGLAMQVVQAGLTIRVQQQMPLPAASMPPGMTAEFMRTMMIAGAVVGFASWVAYFVAMLILITRRDVAEAFKEVAAREDPFRSVTPPAGPPDLPPMP